MSFALLNAIQTNGVPPHLNTSRHHSLLLEDPEELPNHTTLDPTRLSVPHLLPLNLVLPKPNPLPLFPLLPSLLPLEEA